MDYDFNFFDDLDYPVVTPVEEVVQILSRKNEVIRMVERLKHVFPGVDFQVADRIKKVAIQEYGYPIEGRHWLTGKYCVGLPMTPNIGRDM